MAYARAVRQFFDWCEQARAASWTTIEPLSVAAYIEQLGAGLAKPTVKQHLAAIRHALRLVGDRQASCRHNPASAVRGPKYVVRRGKTPVLSAEEARKLLDSID